MTEDIRDIYTKVLKHEWKVTIILLRGEMMIELSDGINCVYCELI